MAESLERALKAKIKEKNLGRVQNKENLMFEKDCHSFYMEDGLVRAKWKQEECCPGALDEKSSAEEGKKAEVER